MQVFEGRRQLIAYFHMWHSGKPSPDQCSGCTFCNGQVRGLPYLHSRDVTFATFSEGPYEESAFTLRCVDRARIHESRSCGLIGHACVGGCSGAAGRASDHLVAQQRADPLVDPRAVEQAPLPQRRLDEESGLLGDPARRDVACLAAPLDEFDARRRDGPLADRPDRGGGDATLAGARIGPVPDFGCARLSQAQADPAQPGASGSILSDELAALDLGQPRFRPADQPSERPAQDSR